MERGVESRDTAPLIGYESLIDLGPFGQVMGKMTAADIQRLAATNSTEVYRANEIALAAAEIYFAEARQTGDDAERERLTGYAARSLTIASMLSERTSLFDPELGTPAAHLVALTAEWKSRDPIAHQTVVGSMIAKTAPAAQPKDETSRSGANIKKSTRIISIPVALAAASAILSAQPAAADDKPPVSEEATKTVPDIKQEASLDTQKASVAASLGRDVIKQIGAPAREEVVASGIPLEAVSKSGSTTASSGDNKAQSLSDEAPASPAGGQNKADAGPAVKQVAVPPKPAEAPASVAVAKKDSVQVGQSEHVDAQKPATPPFAAVPVDLDTLPEAGAVSEGAKAEGAKAKAAPADGAEYTAETVGRSEVNAPEVVPTAPVTTQVNLDTFQPDDTESSAMDTPVPTVANTNNALPNIDTLFDKHEAIDDAVVATEPATQRPVELPKVEAPKPAPQEAAPATPAATQEHGPYQLNAEQNNIIDTLNLSADKKAFLRQVTAGAVGLHLRGSKVNPEVVIAQSILESGWGNSDLTKQANNYFGMKASSDWTGKTISMPTGEFINGAWVTVDAQWRAFDNAEDCFAEYAKFIEARPHFADALQYTGNPEEYVKALVNGNMKYATDPDYIQKIMGTVKANRLSEIVKIADSAEAERSAKAAAEAKATADAKAAETQLAAAKQEREAANLKWHLPVPPESRQSPQYPGHKGIDYAVNTGTPFFASIGGTVKVLTYDVSDAQFCKDAMANIGTTMAAVKDPIQKEVRITTKIGDDTYEVIYAHMSQIDVKDGQVVEGGQQIGLTGGSGCSTGPHAHFEIRKNGKAISPTEVLNGVDVRTLSGKVVVVAKGAADPAEYENTDEHGHVDIDHEGSQESVTVYVDIAKVQKEATQDAMTDEQKKWWNAQKRLADWKRQAAQVTH